jgi:trk system potassium uptake protein TrkA
MKMNVVIAGYSTFTWELAAQLQGKIGGRLYFVLPEWDQAMEASMQENVIAIRGELTNTDVLDQLDLENCHTFIAGSREDEANVLSALYARNKGALNVYARIFETKFMQLLESVGIVPIQTSHTAAAYMAISILKPAVSDLVSLTRGQFDLEEIRADDFPELIGCQLGSLQGENLHIIALAREGDVQLGSTSVVEPDSKLIIVYDNRIKKRLRQELHRVATQAIQRLQNR